MRINLDHNNYSGSTNKQDLRKFTKADFIFIQSAIILFMISIGYLIQNNFMVDLDSKLEKEMINTILNNRTLSKEINIPNFKQCKYILDYFGLNKFKKNLKNYERHKDVTRILAYSEMSISIILFTTILILIKTTSILYLNIFKKASILLCLIFLITEFLTIVFYLSIYLKSFNMYTYMSHILENKCFSMEIFNNFDEKIIYSFFVNSFIPETKFVYIGSIILIVIHFANWLILLYKIKLLLIANMNNSSLNSTLISKFNQQSEPDIKAYDDLFNYTHQEKYPFYELNIYNKL